MLSKYDRDRHYIGVGQLMSLYGLTYKDKIIISGELGYKEKPNDIHLYPRYNGDYKRIRG